MSEGEFRKIVGKHHEFKTGMMEQELIDYCYQPFIDLCKALDEARKDIFSCFEYTERLLLINNSIQHGVERTWTIKDESQLIDALLKYFGGESK